MMKRLLLAAIAVAALPAVASAQSIPFTPSQTINLQGNNPLVCNLSVGTPAAVDVGIAARGTTQDIASVGVTCNNASGFTTSYASTNASVLSNGGSGAANNLAYQAQVTSADANFGFALKSLTANAADTADSYPTTAFSGVSGTFSIVTANALDGSGNPQLLNTGTFTDTVNVTLAANP